MREEQSFSLVPDHSPHCQQGGRGFKPTPADQALQRLGYWLYQYDLRQRHISTVHRLYTSPEAKRSWQKHLEAERRLDGFPPSDSLVRTEMNKAILDYCKAKGLNPEGFKGEIPVAALIFGKQIEALVEHGQPMPTWFAAIARSVRDAIVTSPGQRPAVRGNLHV